MKHNNHQEDMPSHQQHRKTHQPHRYNRSSFPCSSPSCSSIIPSLSPMSSSSSPTSSRGAPLSPCSSDGNCNHSDDQESAILLYQAFLGNGQPLKSFMTSSDQSGDEENSYYMKISQSGQDKYRGMQPLLVDSDHDASNHTNVVSYGNTDKRHHNESVDNRKHDSTYDEHIDESNSTIKLQKQNPNNENYNDEESTNSTLSNQSQYTSIQSSITVLLSNHRRKIGSAIISLAALWFYSTYKQKSQRDRRHHLQYKTKQSNDLIHQRILAKYRLILQMISHFRISNFFRELAKNRLTNGSSTSGSVPDCATESPLSHLLALAKAGNISKAMLRGSVISYLHSMQPTNISTNPTKAYRWSKTTVPSNNPNFMHEIVSILLNNGCEDITTLPESLLKRFLNGPGLVIFPFAYLGALYCIMRRLQRHQLGDGEENNNTFGWNKNSSGGSSHLQNTTTFDDVAGIDSALQELSEVIAYMRNPDRFHSVGASPPRGILLYGPPGSGKTLLARAIAGEAGRSVVGSTASFGQGATIDCFAVCSGSDFVETYVGRGAARVRSLFRGVREDAWNNFVKRRRDYKRDIAARKTFSMNESKTNLALGAWDSMKSLLAQSSISDEEFNKQQRPMAIIFIDEIDALAKRRDSSGLSSSIGGCDEREQTLNSLLTEMDGFATGSSQYTFQDGPSGVIVIVIAATNRIEVLDPAVLRAGRFDRHVKVPLPDAKGREAIMRVHARRIRYDPSVNFREIAAGKKGGNCGTFVAPTHNFSGADLKNVINEAALLAVRSGNSVVTQKHLIDAVKKIRGMSDRHHRDNSHEVSSAHHWFHR